jgi:hypothetical protein
MRQAGLQSTNPGDPRLLALLDQGATEAEFTGIAAEAVAGGKGWAWALAVVQARRSDAARIALASATSSASAARSVSETAAYLAEQARHAAEVEAERLQRIATRGAANAA